MLFFLLKIVMVYTTDMHELYTINYFLLDYTQILKHI